MRKYSKESKSDFIEKMKKRSKQFAIDTVKFCESLPKTTATRNISFQLIKSATSTAANYRAVCRGRSQKEFYSKLSVAVEEADESQFWFEMIEGIDVICDKNELQRLLKEADEILRILATARWNTN